MATIGNVSNNVITFGDRIKFNDAGTYFISVGALSARSG